MSKTSSFLQADLAVYWYQLCLLLWVVGPQSHHRRWGSKGVLQREIESNWVLEALNFTRLRLSHWETLSEFELTEVVATRPDVDRAREDGTDFKEVEKCKVESLAWEWTRLLVEEMSLMEWGMRRWPWGTPADRGRSRGWSVDSFRYGAIREEAGNKGTKRRAGRGKPGEESLMPDLFESFPNIKWN